ncbi:MAG: large repetitive protein, partial [Acidobacteriota bacterium]|nr:large repetitive protein [Acidobacteriota bacterium]
RVVRNGAGIEGVSVASFGPDQQSMTITASDGSFTLADLAAGPTRVSLRKEDDLIMEQRNLTAPARDVVIDLPPGGKVSGRVIDKATRKPVPAFQAGISASRNTGSMMMMMPPLQRSFTSDDGTFTLENVPTGAVNLVVSAPGYSTGRKGGLTLEEGKALSDVEVELEPGVKLVGRVTAPDGSPVAGAQVRFTPSGNVRMTATMFNDGRATTDAAGEYVLDGLEPGEKSFEFTHEKYVNARKTVDLKGSETRLDVRLEGGLRVTGMVVTDAGAAVADASVEAYSTGFGRSAKTDANGNFTFETLDAGRYTFRAMKAGYAPGKVEDVDVQAGAPVRISLRRGGVIYGHVSGLAEADYANAVVEASAPAGQTSAAVDSSGNYRIEGAPDGSVRVLATVMTRDYSSRKTSQPKTVQMEVAGSQQVDLEFRTDVVVRGRITRDGRPLSAATVSFYPRGRSQTMVSIPADEQGMYSASGLEDGEYSVMVMDTQRITPYQTTYQVRGSATFDIDYRTTSVHGRVVDAATGDPVHDAAIQLRPSLREGMVSSRMAVTDSTGSFAIDFVPAGTYVATAEKEGYGNEARTISVAEGSAPDLDFRISRNDGILLTVVDARDGRPIAAMARVTDAAGQVVYEPNFRGGDSTDPIRLPLGVGTFTVTVSANGYADQTLTLRSPSRQNVALTRGGTIIVRSRASTPRRIRILNPNGTPYTTGWMRRDSFAIDASPATITLPNLVAGTYTLQALGDNDAVLDQTKVVVVDDQTVTVDL